MLTKDQQCSHKYDYGSGSINGTLDGEWKMFDCKISQQPRRENNNCFYQYHEMAGDGVSETPVAMTYAID